MAIQTPQILQQLGRRQTISAQMMERIKQAKTALSAMSGQVDMNQILQQNPQVNQLIGSFGSVDGAIQAVCQQKGIDYQEFMEAMK